MNAWAVCCRAAHKLCLYGKKPCDILFLIDMAEEGGKNGGIMSRKIVVVNAEKMDYDHKLDFSVIEGEVEIYPDSTEEEICERSREAEVLVTKELPVKRSLIERLPDTVRIICEAGTGYNNIDLSACEERGITVCNVPSYSSQRVAHTVIMMILNLSSSMVKQQRMLFEGNHDNFTKCLMVDHREVNGKTLGIVGAGHIGMEVIRVARAMDMNILAYSRSKRGEIDGIRYVSLEELLKNSDYVSLHSPLTEQTYHMIDEEKLHMMKPTAFLINTARGQLIDEKALIQALKEGVIAGAGLDVQEQEPPEEGSPLYMMDQVILTPHMGWRGLETRQRLVNLTAENIKAYLAGKPQNVIV